MAGIAVRSGLNMLVGHRHCTALVVDRVTAHAVTRSRFEDSLDMTGLATHLFMRSQQGKGGRGVVKCSAGLSLDCRNKQQPGQACQQGHPRKNPEKH